MGKTRFYIDFKSPYAYLAVAPVRELEHELGQEFDWLPYTLDIPAYLGSAKVDGEKVLEQDRNAHQWRRVKYSYMDCRREANRRGLTILGTRKIFDSSLANMGLLHAKDASVSRAYVDRVYERFWKRELDIEDVAVVGAVLRECGADAGSFAAFVEGEGRSRLLKVQAEAEAAGVFGVPSFLLPDGELFWGREHIPFVKEKLAAA